MEIGARVLVTGAAGFVASHVIARLLESKIQIVVGLDNLNSYYSKDLKMARLIEIDDIARQSDSLHRWHFRLGDVCDSETLADLFEMYQFTHIIHLAAQAGVRAPDHFEFIRSNVECWTHLLEVQRKYPAVKMIAASSSSVYGHKTDGQPFSELDPVWKPSSIYGASKLSMEAIARAYHNMYGLSLVMLRFFTVFGAWGRPDMAYFKFAVKIANAQPITVFNHGQSIRDFTYIADIVNGILLAANTAKPRAFDIFNLGSDRPTGLMDFINTLEELLGKPAVKNFEQMNAADVPVTWANLSHAREVLGYERCSSLRNGLKAFVDWFQGPLYRPSFAWNSVDKNITDHEHMGSYHERS